MGYQKLGVNTGHRKAMLRNLVTSLFRDERINTTEARAKEVKSIAEKLVSTARRGTWPPDARPWPISTKKMWCANYLTVLLLNTRNVRAATPASSKPATGAATQRPW